MRRIQRGSTDQSVVLRIIDESTGIPETGVLWNTAGIDLWYRREGATKTSIVEATLATLDAAHADGGFLAIGDGYYRLDLPDAAVATAAGVNGVMVGGAVTGMIVLGCYVELTAYNPYDAMRAGLTALPNAAADAAGGLPISDAGGLDIDAKLANTNEVTAARMGALTDWINGGRLDAILDIIAADTTTDIPAVIAALDALIDTVKADTADIHTDVGTAITAIGDVHAADLPAVMTMLTDIHGTDLPAVKADTAAILTDTGTTLDGRIPAALVGGRIDANVGSQSNIDFGTLQKASLNAATPANIAGSVGSVAGNIGGNVIGSVGSVVSLGLKKNTALAKFSFVMTDITTHAPKPGVTPTCTRSIDGGAFSAGTMANITEQVDAVGVYLVDLGAGDMNGNVITFRATAAGCDDTIVELVTHP